MEGQQEAADLPLPFALPPLHSLPSPTHDSPSPPLQEQLSALAANPALQLDPLTDLTDSDAEVVVPRSHFTRSRQPRKEGVEAAAAPKVEVVHSRRSSTAQKVVKMEVDELGESLERLCSLVKERTQTSALSDLRGRADSLLLARSLSPSSSYAHSNLSIPLGTPPPLLHHQLVRFNLRRSRFLLRRRRLRSPQTSPSSLLLRPHWSPPHSPQLLL